ncbi:MAG: diguanylate cyclase [Muricomes sp.]
MRERAEMYTIKECIYSSRSSILYRAEDELTGEAVILKTMGMEGMSAKGLARLKNEYALLSRLKSSFVSEAVDFIKRNEEFFLVLKYIKGVPLSEYMKDHKIGIKHFLFLVQDIVRGLADIHNAGIIHKDLNPSNIVYDTKTRKPVIIDFGISAEFSFEKPLMIDLYGSEGTLSYISPEQTGRVNRVVDFRTDFYSLGVMFFEMLCGVCPFTAESPSELIYNHVAKIPATAKSVNSKVPEMLSRIVAKLMAKMPEDRYLSTEGILFDLNQCLTSYNDLGEIPEFELGLGDYSNRIEIPHKLYGREPEMETLKEAYRSISHGGKCAVFIGGYAGIGKTSLVDEMQKTVLESGGVLLSGKYDQYQRNVPYHIFFQMIETFCDIILSENEYQIAKWKTRISNTLGEDAGLLASKVPRLALLMGHTSAFPELSPLETEVRFKVAIQRLLAVIAAPHHPVVIFLDDTHLLSPGTADILEGCMSDENINGLMLIYCYRDNEVDDNHIMTHSMNRLVNQNTYYLNLYGITLDAVTQMIADTLKTHTQNVSELSKIVYNKTLGNPFYVKQFLMICHMNELIQFSRSDKKWIWNIEEIASCPAEDNVIEFLMRNMDQLLPEAIELLSFGACDGRNFSMDVLTALSGKTQQDISRLLGRAIFLEIVYPIQSEENEVEHISFQFSHDRFQQTFYVTLPEKKRQHVHYMLARYYEKADSVLPEDIFIVADHYSKAFGMLDLPEEQKTIAEVLVKAAKTACELLSYSTALGYLEPVIENMDPFQFEGDDFIFSVYETYHRILCSLSKYEEADRIYLLLEQLADSPLRICDSCCLQAVGLSNRGEYRAAFMLGIGVLEQLGVEFPEKTLYDTVTSELKVYCERFEQSGYGQRIDRIKAIDEKEFAIAKILNRTSAAGFFFNPLYVAWSIMTNAKRIFKYGYTSESMMLYAHMPVILMTFRDNYDWSYAIVDEARNLAEQEGYKNELFRIYHVFSSFTLHWFEDVKEGIPYARESFKGNDTLGDSEFACYSYFTTQQIVLETCQTIRELAAENEAAMAYAAQKGNVHATESYISYTQLYKALKGTTKSYGSFEDESFSEERHLSSIGNDQMAKCYYYTLRALSAAIYLDYDKAYELTSTAIPLMPAIGGFYPFALHNFLHSLAICKRLEYHECGREEQMSLRRMLEENQRWLAKRAEKAPANFLHLHSVIRAEMAALDNRGTGLPSLYEKAIREAEKSGRPYHYAMICELAALRFLKLDAPKTAANFLREAYSAYLAWEADGKAGQLWSENYNLLSVNYTGQKGFYRSGDITTSLAGANHDRKNIDFNALITASQAISGEMELESILEKLMSVLQEVSCAQDIYYLTKNETGSYNIRARGDAEGGSQCGECVNPNTLTVQSCCISLGVLYYVDRTKETIVLDNAGDSELFMLDEHIVNYGSKSLLCMPVIHRGDLKGILYLENRLIEGAFDERCLEALRIISAQLAISLDNSYLYSNLQELVDGRTKELREEIKTREKIEEQLVYMANHDTLTNLANRRMFHNHLEASMKAAAKEGGTIAVLFVDLDGFKYINDRYGHDAGDMVLISTAGRLTSIVRSCDMVSRLGGDEFVLIIEKVENRKRIEILCERLIDVIKQPIEIDEAGTKVVVTSSIGISISELDGSTAEELINNADKAMYVAKNNGKNQYTFYEES